jgi:lysozyme
MSDPSANSKMPLWQKGAALIIAIASSIGIYYEGTRHAAYPDPAGAGPWTICEGHTQGVKPGDTATDAQCREYLQQDMGDAYATVTRCITAPLTVSQAAAFTDAAYNVGPAIVCGSTLQKLANSGDVRGACEQLLRWTHAGGKEMPGLVARRKAERDLCVGGIQ